MTTRFAEEELMSDTEKASQDDVVLSARGLSKAFGGQIVLNDISFTLKRGEVVLLRGENGSGKTTLLNILTGNLKPDAGELHFSVNSAREVFRWPRRWWQNLNPFDHFTPERIAWEGVGRVWQDIRLFPTMTVLDNVVLSSPKQAGENPVMALLRLGRINKEELYNEEKAGRWLNSLGLGERLHSSCDKISLGQMKRVAIARAVQAGAKILFLDEPLSGLDGVGVAEVMRYLDALVRTDGLTIVLVEHVFNIPRVLDLATTVWTLADGGLTVENTEAAQRSPRSDEGLRLHSWLNEVAGPDGKVVSRDLRGGVRLTTAIPKGTEDAPVALEVTDLVVRRGYRTVLDRFSICLRKGQLTLLESPNGWGKSTLLDAIAGVLPAQSGEIVFNGDQIHALAANRRIEKGMSYLRSREAVFGSLSIAEHQKLSRGTSVTFGENSHNGHIKANLLSGGQRQKLLIEMLPKAGMYLLDEPFIGLDSHSVSQYAEYLQQQIGGNKTIFMAMPETTNSPLRDMGGI